MQDWESIIGDVGSGALTGSVAGLPGAIAGGALGLFEGLFGSKKQTPQYNDPYAGLRQYGISQLINSNIGREQATAEAGQQMNYARDLAEQARNNPNLNANAAASAAVENKIQRQGQRGARAAYLQGAQIDSENKARGLSAAAQGSEIGLQQFEANQAYKDRLTMGQQLLGSTLSTGAGMGLSNLLGGGGGQTQTPGVAPHVDTTGIVPTDAQLSGILNSNNFTLSGGLPYGAGEQTPYMPPGGQQYKWLDNPYSMNF